MLEGTSSGCINHPAVEAVARCKQCGRPVCGACMVPGPTGRFCSDSCKEKHEKFIQRAQELNQTSRRTGDFRKIKRLLVKLVIYLVAIGALGFVSIYFEIPVLAHAFRRILSFLAPYLPF